MAFGALFVNKPPGMTSFQVVHRVRKKFQLKRVGHCGTLDPDATGLLILLIEEGTRFQRFIMADEKRYSGVIRLGISTTTDDMTGEVLAEGSVPTLSDAQLRELERHFTGTILQSPPKVSAIKVDGERAYQRVRAGEVLELKPREVRVERLALEYLDASRLAYQVDCSKGFYVRSLARDIGERLGCGGATESIHRERIGTVTLERAIDLEELLTRETLPIQSIRELLSAEQFIEVSDGELRELLLGRSGPLARFKGELGERGAFLSLMNGVIRGRLDSAGRVEFLIPES